MQFENVRYTIQILPAFGRPKIDDLSLCFSADYNYLDIMNQSSIEEIVVNKNIDTIVHFSALLSAVGESNVSLALQVNCRGVENVLQVAA